MKQVLFGAILLLIFPALWAQATPEHELTVYKTPWCGCCSMWAEYMDNNGFSVVTIEVENIEAYKQKHGVPRNLASCHTAIVEGYVIEGHVPAADVLNLLREKPEIVGLTVPGMPIGSPGMEQGSRVQAYDVIAIRKDGTTYTYNKYEGRE